MAISSFFNKKLVKGVVIYGLLGYATPWATRLFQLSVLETAVLYISTGSESCKKKLPEMREGVREMRRMASDGSNQ